MSEVVPIREGIVPVTPSGTPDPEIVQVLKDILGMAERGELQGISMALVRSDGFVTTRWKHGTGTGFNLLGATSRLLYRLNSQV